MFRVSSMIPTLDFTGSCRFIDIVLFVLMVVVFVDIVVFVFVVVVRSKYLLEFILQGFPQLVFRYRMRPKLLRAQIMMLLAAG